MFNHVGNLGKQMMVSVNLGKAVVFGQYLIYISLILSSFVCILCTAEDYYDLLGITRSADDREIRRAFKKLALTLHPDKNKDDPEANEKFIKINKAYEVLKNEESRRKYDLHGEEGLKDDFGKGWRGNFHSWNYYYENFGIYDDDPEIITLGKSDFEQSVLSSFDTWFVNFYSPQCSHCHHLAPAWRQLARELEGVIRIGAVNCEEDWSLCRQQGIHSYPSLIMYPKKEPYLGPRDTDSMVEHVLRELKDRVIMVTDNDFDRLESIAESPTKSWLLLFCSQKEECLLKETEKKLGIMLDGLINVGSVDCLTNAKTTCKKLGLSAGSVLFSDISRFEDLKLRHTLEGSEAKEIVEHLLSLLPEVEKISDERFKEITKKLKESNEERPWLLYFVDEDAVKDSLERELKRLPALLPGIHLGKLNCRQVTSACKSFHFQKFPVFIIFKSGGSHVVYHGRTTANDIATFVRDSLSSRVETLQPSDFPDRVIDGGQPWFVDFYAPWCPPCMHLLPEWRKASRLASHLVNFGTVDCTVHSSLCSKYNIRSYPTAILYNQSVPHQFTGHHTAADLVEFIQDMLSPSVINLSPSQFSSMVETKVEDEMWLIDFFAPWCGPCQQLAPQWRKLAKMIQNETKIHIGQVDCQAHHHFCSQHGVSSYPNIRLYPTESKGISKFYIYNGWNRDAASLRAWAYNFLPSVAKELKSDEFFDHVLYDKDPWIIDFYTPWCRHCQIFAPEFETVARQVQGKVKAGKVNCDRLPHVCHHAGVHAYPTISYYAGVMIEGKEQSPYGQEINSQTASVILSHIEEYLKRHHKATRLPRKDEL